MARALAPDQKRSPQTWKSSPPRTSSAAPGARPSIQLAIKSMPLGPGPAPSVSLGGTSGRMGANGDGERLPAEGDAVEDAASTVERDSVRLRRYGDGRCSLPATLSSGLPSAMLTRPIASRTDARRLAAGGAKRPRRRGDAESVVTREARRTISE
eukprot:CAMPEP_0174830012 /NCGR_PEP_ID=MMETSP1114-20130205/2291_1 /TAXON_ID=312471 /ORGANISM="Neobodo designis, Strain CCAP 1951/1" /LENGTH=154 /DNA_ID=CAMNT_0016063795 /DNA_START=474 /DNA_END=938 /DNA_ORIENTATION=+